MNLFKSYFATVSDINFINNNIKYKPLLKQWFFNDCLDIEL